MSKIDKRSLDPLNLRDNIGIQQEILQRKECVFVASAGSGKTFTLVAFILGILGTGTTRPHELMGLTFGNDAASDLKDRIITPLEKISNLDLVKWGEACCRLKQLRETYGSSLPEEVKNKSLKDQLCDWDKFCIGSLKDKRDGAVFAIASYQWITSEIPPGWFDYRPEEVRGYWVSIRREAESLPVQTVHSAALRAIGSQPECIVEASDPELLRLLRTICREKWGVLSQQALRLELYSAFRYDWKQLAEIYDAFRDTTGYWRKLDDKGAKKMGEEADDLIAKAECLKIEYSELYTLVKDNKDLLGALTKEAKIHLRFNPDTIKEPKDETDELEIINQIKQWVDIFYRTNKVGESVVKKYFNSDIINEDTFDAYSKVRGFKFRIGDERKLKLENEFPERKRVAVKLNKFVTSLREFANALETFATQRIEDVLIDFETRKEKRGWLTYGDIVRKACEELEGSNSRRLPKPKYLFIDEFQDINPIQNKFLNGLMAEHQIVVGDIKQAIYAFRGGDSRILEEKVQTIIKEEMQHSERSGISSKAYSLTTNFRSKKPIVNLSNHLVKKLFPRVIEDYGSFDQDQKSEDKSPEKGHTIAIRLVTPDDTEKAAGKAELKQAERDMRTDNRGKLWENSYEAGLLSSLDWVRSLSIDEGWTQAGFRTDLDLIPSQKSTRALLIRGKSHIGQLMTYLRKHGIKAMLKTQTGRHESPGVRMILALIGLYGDLKKSECLYAVLRSPFVNMTNRHLFAASQLIGENSNNIQSLSTLITNAEKEESSPMKDYLEALRWLKSLERCTTVEILSEGLVKSPGVIELVNCLEIYSELEAERAKRNLESWVLDNLDLSHSPSIAFRQIQEKYEATGRGDAYMEDSTADLLISTIHQSKGLEYDSVILPIFHPVGGKNKKGGLEKLDESFSIGWKVGSLNGAIRTRIIQKNQEREKRDGLNLLYVGMTRAKTRLMILQQGHMRTKEEKEKNEHDPRIYIQPQEKDLDEGKWGPLGTGMRECSEIADFANAVPYFSDSKSEKESVSKLEDKRVNHHSEVLEKAAALSKDREEDRSEYKSKGLLQAKNKEKARREGLKLHGIVRELLIQSDADQRNTWLEGYGDDKWKDIKKKALECVAKIEAKWSRETYDYRTECPISESAPSGGTGFADLVIQHKQNSNEIAVVDYKRTLSDSMLPKYIKQVETYIEKIALELKKTNSNISGHFYDFEKSILEDLETLKKKQDSKAK